MKRTLRKTCALIISMVMLLAIGGTVMAAEDMTNESGVIGEFENPDVATTKDTSVIIYKEITAYNPETCTVNAPTITFNYTISSGTGDELAGKTVTDAESRHNPLENISTVTKKGVGTPTITGTAAGALALVPGTDTLDASENGTANRFPLTVSFEGIDFVANGTGAGIYRYQITETTTTDAKRAAGIAEGTVAKTLYMDVYVDGNGDIYGYVLFTNNGDIDASPDNDADAATAAGKTEGFVGSQADGGTYASATASVADKYYTFNFEVEKEVVGDTYAVNTKQKFPFTITLTNATVTAAVLPIETANDSNLVTLVGVSTAAIAGTWEPQIASGGKVSYVGIPTGTTVAIYETNPVTGVTYKSESTGADADAAEKDIAKNENSNTATINCNATALTKAAENHTEAASKQIKFTNTLKQISPTGIIIRSAPYLLLFAVGAVLFILIRHGKKNAKTEEA